MDANERRDRSRSSDVVDAGLPSQFTSRRAQRITSSSTRSTNATSLSVDIDHDRTLGTGLPDGPALHVAGEDDVGFGR